MESTSVWPVCYTQNQPFHCEEAMPLVDPSHPLADLLERDGRYSLDAYLFILESLSFAQDSLGMGECRQVGSKRTSKKKSERHVTGQELCEAARRYAQQQYGYLAATVLSSWGVRETADFGEIVFNMIEVGQMRKTSRDRREDFHEVYAFDEAFARDLVFAVPDAH